MTRRIVPWALAIALLATLPLDAAFARGGGGGSGGFGGGGGNFGGGGDRGGAGGGFGMGNRGPTDRGTLSYSRPGNPQGDRLFDEARRECSGSRFPSGGTPRIDYSANSFTCAEPGSDKR